MDLAELGTQGTALNIAWHPVRRLPGFSVGQIRAIGRGVFQPFAPANLEAMDVLTTHFGQGGSIQVVKDWLQAKDDLGRPRNAVQIDEATLDFIGGQVPRGDNQAMALAGYRPDVEVWRSRTHAFVVVNENMGGMRAEYIYKVRDDRPLANLIAGPQGQQQDRAPALPGPAAARPAGARPAALPAPRRAAPEDDMGGGDGFRP